MDELLKSLGVAGWVPAPLARWRPLLVDGLVFFLSQLPAPRQTALLAAQLALPAQATSADRMVALLAQCPTLHKLGQVVARHRDLHVDLRHRLQMLESMAPALSAAGLPNEILALLPRSPDLMIAGTALAEGSVALVVPFRYRLDGTVGEGVFKVLKPGVERNLVEELAVWPALAEFLERHAEALGLPALDFRATLESVGLLLAREIDLAAEQRHMADAAVFYADQPAIRVPRLLPWCTPRITAMERIIGIKLNDAQLHGRQAAVVAHALVSALIGKPFWSKSAATPFHGDLHGGNLMLTQEGGIAVLDWSLVTRLTSRRREALVAIAIGAMTLDAPRISRALGRLGKVAPGDPAVGGLIDRALDDIAFRGHTPGFRWLLKLLDDIAASGRVQFGEDLMLLRKTWFALSGVIADLSEDTSPDLPLFNMALGRFIAELPRRALAPADASDFATHLSNAEVIDSGVSAWLTPVRYWSRWQAALGKQLLSFAAPAGPQNT